MSLISEEFFEKSFNPLDLLEELVMANEWPYERASDNELVVETSGCWCDYKLFLFGEKI